MNIGIRLHDTADTTLAAAKAQGSTNPGSAVAAREHLEKAGASL